MIHQSGGDFDIGVLHDGSAASDLMRRDQVFERRAAFVGHAGLDVVVIHLQKQARHFLQRRRSISVSTLVAKVAAQLSQSRLP